MLPTTRWKFPDTQKKAESLIARELGISPIIAQILYNRGITTPDTAKKFLFPSLEHLHNPFLMKDMHKGVDRLIQAIFNKEKIMVYGDYDADGITSTAILVKFLRGIDARTEYYIPGRVEEGYGLSREAIDKFSPSSPLFVPLQISRWGRGGLQPPDRPARQAPRSRFLEREGISQSHEIS